MSDSSGTMLRLLTFLTLREVSRVRTGLVSSCLGRRAGAWRRVAATVFKLGACCEFLSAWAINSSKESLGFGAAVCFGFVAS